MREEGHMPTRMTYALILGNRWEGRQKTRWKESYNRCMESVDEMGIVMSMAKWQIKVNIILVTL